MCLGRVAGHLRASVLTVMHHVLAAGLGAIKPSEDDEAAEEEADTEAKEVAAAELTPEQLAPILLRQVLCCASQSCFCAVCV